MSQYRCLQKQIAGKQTVDGAGVKLVRVIGQADTAEFDPFLLLDAFDSRQPDDYIKGFPWHPHRGIETITYLIHGSIEHGDSLGNQGRIRDGECQWMTAGKGILHQEMPQASAHMLGVQLWLNLPQSAKMTAPAYRDITAADIPVIEEDGGSIRVVAGQYAGAAAGARGQHVALTLLDVALQPEALWHWQPPEGERLFIYLLTGNGKLGEPGEALAAQQAALLSDAGELRLQAGTAGLRCLVFAGRPLNEPVAWGGPIVMNYREELQQAFRELREGTFITK